MSTKPEAGQWWVMDDDPSEIVFVVGFTPEMECVIKWGDGDLSVDDMTDFHHEPRCTGWDWVVPEPQPAEDPDEWVIQDQVPPRKDVDQISWGGGDWHSDWHKAWQFGNMMHGDYPRFGGRLNVRCRRRDLPKVEQVDEDSVMNAIVYSIQAQERDEAIKPQPQKTRVRLWATPEGRPYFAPFQASKRDDEICVDSEGFYVEGGQS